MKKRFLPVAFIYLFMTPLVFAQTNQCGQQWAMKKLDTQFPDYQKIANQTFADAQRKRQETATSRSNAVYQVPVVVHVVYNTPEQNISDELVHSQIRVLNEDFRRLNADADQARDIYKQIGADAEIEFVLAEVDPMGNPTNGITRTQTNVSTFIDIDIGFEDILAAADSCGVDMSNPAALLDSFVCIQNVLLTNAFEENESSEGAVQMDDVKRTAKGGKDPWDTERYINIWVCNLNMDFQGQEMPAILGFAYPPVEAPNWPEEAFPEDIKEIDGLVIHYQAFGLNNPTSGILGDLAAGGRTCTHEMGHYFGLRHIHGDGDCSSDDGINDTPAADANVQPADPTNLPTCEELHAQDSCPEDGLPDMIENYMDYNSQACQNLFTEEQVGIMRAMLEGPRVGLIQQTTTSANDIVTNNALSVFPNPASQKLYLALEGSDLRGFNIEVQSVLGQPAAIIATNNNQALDISHLPAGIYLVRLTQENRQFVRKFLVSGRTEK